MVPKAALNKRSRTVDFVAVNFSFDLSRMTTDTISATPLRNKAFCIVGRSPASLTNTVISEKKKAADNMQKIPLT